MIEFNYETKFQIDDPDLYTSWLSKVIASEGKEEGEINYIFCDDDYLVEMNRQYLDHDTLTDIISFDYTVGNLVGGDVFISIQRVVENSKIFDVSFEEELRRVLVHGILHYCGYKDKSEADVLIMRQTEEMKMKLFHVEH